MIIRGDERLLVQGITGRQGSFWTERMQEYVRLPLMHQKMAVNSMSQCYSFHH